MLFARINRDKKEWSYGVFKNVGSAVARGAVLVLDVSSSRDGNRVTQAGSATLSLFVGVAISAIAADSYGKVQTYGFGKGLVFQSQTTVIAAGNILIPVDSQDYLARDGAGDGKSGFVFAAEAVATVTTGVAALKDVFVRAL